MKGKILKEAKEEIHEYLLEQGWEWKPHEMGNRYWKHTEKGVLFIEVDREIIPYSNFNYKWVDIHERDKDVRHVKNVFNAVGTAKLF